MTFVEFLPLLFMGVMGLSLLIYVVLDGYDLGVGLLLPHATDDEKDTMINSIGPFWDANETWLVLGVGILLVAFPMAHGVVLGELYLPVTLMLFSLIIRGVAFDFRVKVPADKKHLWPTLALTSQARRLSGGVSAAAADCRAERAAQQPQEHAAATQRDHAADYDAAITDLFFKTQYFMPRTVISAYMALRGEVNCNSRGLRRCW